MGATGIADETTVFFEMPDETTVNKPGNKKIEV